VLGSSYNLANTVSANVGHTHDTVAVASNVPFSIFALISTHRTSAVVDGNSIDCGRSKQVGQLVKGGLILRRPVEVDTVLRVVIYLGEQLQFVDD